MFNDLTSFAVAVVDSGVKGVFLTNNFAYSLTSISDCLVVLCYDEGYDLREEVLKALDMLGCRV